MVNFNYTKQLFAITLSVLLSAQVNATTITIVNADAGSQGFNSRRAVNPEGGNNATTLGAAYSNVFRAAADFWESKISSTVEIRVQSSFSSSQICTSTGAQLGGAGPMEIAINFPGAPVQNTIYTIALANALAGEDMDPGFDDIQAQFNSQLDGRPGCLGGTRWWLGINAQQAPRGTISLLDTVLHEIGHGLGFLTFVDQNGRRLADFNDAYMLNLFDVSLNRSWADMNNSQRGRSSVNNGNLVWTGTNVAEGAGVVTGGRNNGFLRMFAPRSFQPGSSVSHWDTALSPNELMEPFATATSNSLATILALQDMGWPIRNNAALIVPAVNLLLDDD